MASTFLDPFWPKTGAKKQRDSEGRGSTGRVPSSGGYLRSHRGPGRAGQDAVTSLKETVRVELLERLQGSTLALFEEAVVNLLMAMGYVGTQGRAAVTGKAHDGGIDGVIDGDALGLDRVFITTSSFSKHAQAYADAVPNRIVLIDEDFFD